MQWDIRERERGKKRETGVGHVGVGLLVCCLSFVAIGREMDEVLEFACLLACLRSVCLQDSASEALVSLSEMLVVVGRMFVGQTDEGL